MSVRKNHFEKVLAASTPAVLDGGMGSELQARGARVIVPSQFAPGGRAWTSAVANLEAPELVREIHADYLRVGADLIISNNFSTAPSHLKWFGLADRWREFSRAGIDIAVSARDAFGPNAAVLGGFAAPGSVARDRTRPFHEVVGSEDAFVEEVRAMGELLVDGGADVVVVEILRYVRDSVLAARALRSVGVPTFLGLFADNEAGGLSSGETFGQLFAELDAAGARPDGIFLHCGNTRAIQAGLPELVAAFDGTVGAYGNVGYDSGAFLEAEQRSNWFNTHGETPYSFARKALAWVDLGARVVGGCCATGPEHILMLKTLLDERTAA